MRIRLSQLRRIIKEEVKRTLRESPLTKLPYAENAEDIDNAYDEALENSPNPNGEVLLSALPDIDTNDLDFYHRYQVVGYPDGPRPQRVIRLNK